MKHLVILLAFIFQLCPQLKSQGIDSMIWYEQHDIELKSTSLQDKKGCLYECISKNLQPGDKFFISYQSGTFTTAAYVKDPNGHIQNVSNNNASTLPFASYDFTFTAGEEGLYEFYFTTQKPHEKGNATVQLFWAHDKKIRIDPLWTSCQKLDFLLKLSHTNFEFVPVNVNHTYPDAGKVVYCNLFFEAPAVIEGLKNADGPRTYRVVYSVDIGLESSKMIMKQVDDQLRKCMNDDWTIEETAKGPGKLEEITYTRKGDYKYEFNLFHKQAHVQDKVCLKTIKSGNDTYDIIFEIY
ncbi:MAG: hypothetical protein JWP12_3446 [Bacteroidetes bacterium]|nr:hypothetical protein [Bacteroidota bacterium]